MKKNSNWTQFMDMHSGGGQKLGWAYVYIEAPQEEAISIFYSKFGRNPKRVTCTCCGSDYSITESPSLEEATAYNRGCDYAYFDKNGKEIPRDKAFVTGKGMNKDCEGRYVERGSKERYSRNYITLNEYKKDKSIKIITKKEIEPDERKADVPEEGYVWQG